MQKAMRFTDNQMLYLAHKAKHENTMNGHLYKKSSDTGKWQLRWFALYQNLLFYFDNENSSKPSGVALLEGSYCDRVFTTSNVKNKDTEKQYCFCVTYKIEGQRQYDLRSDTEADCNAWVDAIKRASYNKIIEQKEELEQKHLHLLQILDSERQAKWHYVQQTEELSREVVKLKAELQQQLQEKYQNHTFDAETEEIKKIKKVQSFFRGWLCRRRWKQIVELYIRSPHAESMRKRNSIVFNMVECEEEYNRQLSTLVTCFLRPLRMAASSKKPPITHEDVNSIFLNSETLLFLHQIFFKGLCARLENWPTLVLGDLFDMLLPMLCIYQEYVRNHHYSLQVLAEYKQKIEFNNLLKRYEEKPACEARSLEQFLTYPMHQTKCNEEKQTSYERNSIEKYLTIPMHQVPRYIITLHELLAHTPHDHVERKSLEFAQSKLEELSRIMHDEVSETENIRKNLAIERMIIEGCDILLDVNQTFVRQGPLLHVLTDKPKSGRSRLGSIGSFKESKKENIRQVFLFTNHMLITARASNGRLHLAKDHYCDYEFATTEISLSNQHCQRKCLAKFVLLQHAHDLVDDCHLKLNISNLQLCLTSPLDWSDRAPPFGKIPLIDCTLIEDPNSDLYLFDDETASIDSYNSAGSATTTSALLSTQITEKEKLVDYNGLDFKIIVDSKSGPPTVITLVSSTYQEKAAWCSDISQCIENLHYSDLLNSSMSESSSVTMPQSVRSDPKLFRDDVDIKFSRTLNSCKVPQIRHASVDRLLDRLTDLRFLSIDFLNTFLLTYRVFTTGQTILEALRKVYRSPESGNLHSSMSSVSEKSDEEGSSSSPTLSSLKFSSELHVPDTQILVKPQAEKMRRISTGCMRMEISGESDTDPPPKRQSDYFLPKLQRTESAESDDSVTKAELLSYLAPPSKPKLAPIASCETLCDNDMPVPTILTDDSLNIETFEEILTVECDSLDNTLETFNDGILAPPVIGISTSSETLVGTSPCTLSSARSSDTLTPGTPFISPMTSPLPGPRKLSLQEKPRNGQTSPRRPSTPVKLTDTHMFEALALSPTSSPVRVIKPGAFSSPIRIPLRSTSPKQTTSPTASPSMAPKSPSSSPKLRRMPSPISYSYSSPSIVGPQIKSRPFSGKRGSVEAESITTTPRSSFAQVEGSPPPAKAGAVVTSSRASKRRSSSSAATTAFAAATAGSANPIEHPKGINRFLSAGAGATDTRPLKKRESVISTAATMRVLNVLKHWVSKHQQDFESDNELKAAVTDLLEEMVCNTNLLPAEHKAAASILRTITKETTDIGKVDLAKLLVIPKTSSKDTFDTLSALDIAEQLTYLDHQIFMAIRSEELLCQAWMKPDKARKAPHVLLVSKRFNEVSRLVVSEIVGRQNQNERVSCIEKWAAIADICRCMHNYNGVLQICAAFVNSSVYRLKKTWEKLSKQTKNMIDRLQNLVSSDGRFRNMRDALHRCDPPAIPYLGMYLTDLSFIEEGTPNLTDDGLVNFSKMRMVAHVIREIKLFQQTPYRIEHHSRVTNYLLDPTRLLDEEQTYKASLAIEPKQSRLSVVSAPS